jgi:hypothetical protein
LQYDQMFVTMVVIRSYDHGTCAVVYHACNRKAVMGH